ncbi:uncharacterized protein CANTADRAFT_331558 [Suhomyces tanzawaensis NRRL Y-17324]|uniref:Uncharacterized protein n=1 Tax=Suhomyces tanzawaensis NRRL Y-17324 TaxID=984487 RepID=A0A1E4SB91_9ASCO|nr:uncharacterized protein CANTADRAFT_331558 [Suhomyces tanzawaensis NRRL Y-17324]ODV76784.1 hypothetical protein CANTADRAFT_331558 [Suhomyces tanzawaensis NRRL Y-17324]
MATVTTTKKKKLVYKQDPDGVFRLKKVDTDEPLPHQPAPAPDSTPGLLNELLDCSYQIVPPPAEAAPAIPAVPAVPAPAEITPEPVHHAHHSHHVHPVPEPMAVPLAPQPASATDPGVSWYESGPAHDRRRKKSKLKQKPKSRPTLPPQPPLVVPRVNWMRMAADHTSAQAKQFHPPSFVLGATTAGVLYVLRAALTHYALVVFDILKFAILWGVLLVVICWWTGLIKPQDTERISDALTRMKLRMVTDAIPAVPIPRPQPERRNTLTKVTPFKFQPKNERHQSTPDLHQHAKPAQPQPKLTRIHTTGLRTSPQKTSPAKVSPRKARNGSIDTSASHKRLPPYPKEAEELPFINEVKLVSDQASEFLLEDAHAPPAVASHGAPKRLNTYSSKQ